MNSFKKAWDEQFTNIEEIKLNVQRKVNTELQQSFHRSTRKPIIISGILIAIVCISYILWKRYSTQPSNLSTVLDEVTPETEQNELSDESIVDKKKIITFFPEVTSELPIFNEL